MNKRTLFAKPAIACLLSVCICLFLGCEEDDKENGTLGNGTNQTDVTESETKPVTIVLDESDSGSKKSIRIGDTLQLELEGNPTTGYEWEIESYDTSILNQVGEREYEQDPQPNPDHPVEGLGGTFTFRFRATATGSTFLRLIYHRPWESVPPHEVFEITVTIQ